MFSLVSVCLSTPPAGQATHPAGGMPLAFSQDFLVEKQFSLMFLTAIFYVL